MNYAVGIGTLKGLSVPRDQRKISESNSSVAQNHDRTGVEIMGQPVQVVEQQRGLVSYATTDLAPKQDHARGMQPFSGQQLAEVGVQGQENPGIAGSLTEDDRIRCTDQIELTDMEGVVTSLGKYLRQARGEALVDQEPQAPRRSGSSRSLTASAA